MSADCTFMYPYTEPTGKKTLNGNVSFLHHFLDNRGSRTVKKSYVCTDSCTAQNRNNAVVKYLYHLVINGCFDYICHVFPTKGNTYLPCD
jgi:hypothetical protein